MSHVVIGTAGHIDHGKTALVKALTGTDTDRLPEEKKRGVTIDIGFAFLGEKATIIDVPGHERFIKNMVTGVSSISYVLFVVAADDGVMPQTQEHLDILSLLNVQEGATVINKIDLVKTDWINMVEEDVKKLVSGSFLEGSPVFRTSALSGEGIEKLGDHLKSVISEKWEREDRGYFRLPVDRSFSVKGFGTVVTGTVISGSVKKGDSVEVLPGGFESKVRGIQKHNEEADEALIGERAALNLSGLSTEEVVRGSHIAAKGYLNPTTIFEGRINLLKSAPKALSNRNRVRLHLGTGEVMSRISILGSDVIEPGESGFVQFFLEKEAAVAVGDKFIVRRYSPSLTIGGGRILQVSNVSIKRNNSNILNILKVIDENDYSVTAEMLAQNEGGQGITPEEFGIKLGISEVQASSLLNELTSAEKLIRFGDERSGTFYSPDTLEKIKKELFGIVESFVRDNPLSTGIKRAELKGKLDLSNQAFDILVTQLEKEDKLTATAETLRVQGSDLSGVDSEFGDLEEALLSEGFNAPTGAELSAKIGRDEKETHQLIKRMIGEGKVVRLDGDFFLHSDFIDELKLKVEKHFEGHEELSVAELKNLTGVSRKFAIPLLLYLDDNEITRREGNVRKKI